MWLGPQPNAISMDFYSWRSSHMIKYNKSTVVNFCELANCEGLSNIGRWNVTVGLPMEYQENITDTLTCLLARDSTQNLHTKCLCHKSLFLQGPKLWHTHYMAMLLTKVSIFIFHTTCYKLTKKLSKKNELHCNSTLHAPHSIYKYSRSREKEASFSAVCEWLEAFTMC